MKKVTNKVKSERGVTLVALIAMIIIIFSILSVVLYNGRTSIRLEKLNDIYSDISLLEDKIQLYYYTNMKVPTTGEGFFFVADDINPNDGEREYYSINIGVLDSVNLNNDISNYIVNADTLTVYYKDGYEYKDINYHTIPREFAKLKLSEDDFSDKYSIYFTNVIRISDRNEYEGEYNGQTINYGADGDKYELPRLSKVRVGWTEYYFKGWLGDDDKYYTSAYRGSPSRVTAQWSDEVETIRVTFYNGSTKYTTRDYVLGEPYGEFPDPPSSGKTFTGWRNKEGDMITEDMIATASDTELYAVWGGSETRRITITFNPLDGTVDTKTKEVTYGNRYGTLPEPIPYDRNYEFDGWYLEREFKNKITENSIVNVTEDTTLYAKYVRERKEFNVTFDYNYPVIHSPKTEVKGYNNGERYGSMPQPADVNGWKDDYSSYGVYEFVGWNTRKDGRGKTITSNTIVDLDGDITLYAQWKKRFSIWD